jgi:GNAT superfamily N-acetyltransferase
MNAHHEREDDGLVFSTDKRRLDIALIHDFLSRESYWVPGIHRELIERAIENSLCFGAYEHTRQLAFARVITDGAGFAWLADVFVVADARGRHVGTRLIDFVMAHPDLQRIRRFMLATRDAHTLYARFGFTPLAHPDRLMERYDAQALSRPLPS